MSASQFKRRKFLRLIMAIPIVSSAGFIPLQSGATDLIARKSSQSTSALCKKAKARLEKARKELRKRAAAEQKAIRAESRAKTTLGIKKKRTPIESDRRDKARAEWDKVRFTKPKLAEAKQKALTRATDRYIKAKNAEKAAAKAFKKAKNDRFLAKGQRAKADTEFRRAFDNKQKRCKITDLPKTGLKFKRPPRSNAASAKADE